MQHNTQVPVGKHNNRQHASPHHEVATDVKQMPIRPIIIIIMKTNPDPLSRTEWIWAANQSWLIYSFIFEDHRCCQSMNILGYLGQYHDADAMAPSITMTSATMTWLLMVMVMLGTRASASWYCLCRMNRSLSSMRKDSDYLCHLKTLNVEKW